MDHLPLPNRARMPYPKVPLSVCSTRRCYKRSCTTTSRPVDGGLGHGEVATLQQAFLAAHTRVASLDMAGPFFQSRLWFGAIERVFSTVGVTVHLTDFITADDTCGFRLDTSLLHRYLWYWVAAEAGVSRDLQVRHEGAIAGHLQIVSSVLCNFHACKDPSPDQFSRLTHRGITDNSNNILLSISLLAEFVDGAKFDIYRSGPWSRLFLPIQVIKWLHEAGWCGFEIESRLFSHTFSVSALLYLTRVNRSLHPKSHEGCSIDKCVRSILDPATYRPVHVDEDCICSEIGWDDVQKLEVDTLLRGDNYPVMTCSGTDPFSCWLTLDEPTAVDGVTRYVAISHVWSDRLGNLHENALPACQLQRIQREVNLLYPLRAADIPFWIDTLCVPREDAARRPAIQSMRNVYEQAEKVLVLDSTVRSIHSEASAEEVLLVIKLSPWSERLWTWHESVLARSIYFQLQNRAVDADDLHRRYHTEFSLHPAVIELDSLIKDCDGPNQALCRDLIRVMILSDDTISASAIRKSAIYPGLPESTRDADEASRCISDVKIEPARSKTWRRDDKDMTDSMSPGFVTGVEHSGCASELGSKSSTMVAVDYGSMTLKLGAGNDSGGRRTPFPYDQLRLNGFSYPQRLTSSVSQPAVPRDWLARKSLSPSETRLWIMILRIARVTSACQYWLKGFNPVFDEGGGTYPSLRTPIRYLRLTGFMKSSQLDKKHKLDPRELAEVFRAVSHRTTSWIEDEAICIGIVLDLKPGRLYQTEPSKRMEDLVRMWTSVPRALLFTSGSRMGEQGLRWMPKSLLNSRGHFSFETKDEWEIKSEAIRTKHGLAFEGFAAFVIYSEMQETDSVGLFILHNEGDCFAIFRLTASLQTGRGELSGDVECAVIFETVPKHGGISRAALVAVRRQEKNVIFADLIGHVTVVSLDERQKSIVMAKSRKAAFTSIQQKWCVD